MQAAHALHANGRCARAFNLCAHRGKQGSQVGHLRFAGAVLHQGFALSQHGGHQQVFRPSDGNLVENKVCASQPIRPGLDV